MSATGRGAAEGQAAPEEREPLERLVNALLRQRGETLAVAESLTGGLVGERVSAIPGASETFRGGVIAYATDVKAAVLGVPAALLDDKGAVEPEVALAMATGVRDLLGATYGLALTGVAGPDPQDGHPAGVVYIAVAGPRGQRVSKALRLTGTRLDNRREAAARALQLLRTQLEGQPSR